MYPEKKIFICGNHKSGTSLFRNLLDSHPSLNVVPIETHFIKCAGFPLDYYYQRQIKKFQFSREEFAKRAVKILEGYNTNQDKYNDADFYGLVDLDKVNTSLKELYGLTEMKDVYDWYMKTIYHSTMNVIPDPANKFVEKSVENAETARYYKMIFPSAKFIHIVRNPYANLVSLRKYKSGNKISHLSHYINILRNNMLLAMQNKSVYGDDYYILKYEDLLLDSEGKMKDIASFLEIDYNETLLTPTVSGSNWVGNSVSNEKFTGLSKNTLHGYKKSMTPIEVHAVNSHLSDFMKEFGYEKEIMPSSKIYFPNKGESLGSYFVNRAFLKSKY